MKAKYAHIEDDIVRKKMINKNRQLKCRYGITLEDWEKMYEEQGGKCKICLKEKRLVVEHNHINKKVRGLTCDRCNQLIGHLEHASFNYVDRIHSYLYNDGDLEKDNTLLEMYD